MKIGIICSQKSDTVVLLLKEGRRKSHIVKILYLAKFSVFLNDEGENTIFYGHTKLADYDAFIVRLPAEKNDVGISIVRQIEARGAPCFNGWVATSRANNKFRTQQILSLKNFNMPKTFITNNSDFSKNMLNKIGMPVIIKFFNGLQGVGVMKCETPESAISVIESVKMYDSNVLVQECICESSGKDIRCFVVGNKVVASMERDSEGKDFRANISQGGTARKIDLSKEEKDMAIAATRELGLDICGVDLLRSRRGTLIIELNASPGLVGIEKYTGVSVKSEIFDHIVRKVNKINKKRSAVL